MKRLLIISACLLLGSSVMAQTWFMSVDQVKPSGVYEYEAALEQFIKFLDDKDFTLPIEVHRSSDFYYYIHIPMENGMSDLDRITEAFNLAAKKDTTEWWKINDKFSGTYTGSTGMCYKLLGDLSYIPENTGSEDEEMNYIEVWFCTINTGMSQKFTGLMKEYKKLCKEKGINSSYYLYKGLIGMDQNLFIFATPAKNPGHLWEMDSKMNEILGEEGRDIGKKLMKTFQEVELKQLWYLKKFAYKPVEADE